MANTYPQGQTVRITARFYDQAGQLTEPEDAQVRVRRPDGVVETYAFVAGGLERTGDGSYEALVPTGDVAGRYLYRSEGTAGNDVATVYQSYFDVSLGF